MAELVKAVPAEGRRVRTEEGAVLPLDGKPVALSPYWRRREDAGDVTLGPIDKPARTAKKSAAKDT